MFCQEIVIVFTNKCVPFAGVFGGFPCSCIDLVYALLACTYIINSSPSLCSLYLGEVLCLLYSGS
jgi:hypothetical protein